jgi:hypothetical protein
MQATSPAYYGHQKHPPHNAYTYNGLQFELLHCRAGKETGRFSQNWTGVKKRCQNVQNILLYMYLCLRKRGPIILATLIPHHVNLLIKECNSVDYNGILCSKITMTLAVHIPTNTKPISNRICVGPVSPSDTI